MTSKEMDELLAAWGADAVYAQAASRIRSQILADTKPARRLPSPVLLTLAFFLLGATVAVAGGTGMGALGFQLMNPLQRFGIFGVLFLLLVFGAVMASRSMRPASGRLYGSMLTVISLAIPEMIFAGLFRSYDQDHFLHVGLVCLAIGLAFAIPTTALAWWTINRGFVVNPTTAGMLAGLLGGLAGLAMLEVHCPLQAVPHVGVWHMAVVAVSLGLGAGLGRIRSTSAEH